MPAVSVLMSVHDGAPGVAPAVASVLGQTAGDLELIVVDDGSTDATADLLAAVRDPRLRVIRQARTGLTRALNAGLARAAAPLVARLGAGGDDETLPVAQDYDLWMRLAQITRLANRADVLVVRTLGARRVSVEREDDRLRAETRVRWRAVRAGAYPPWCALFAVRPALALALPRPLRRLVRAALGGASP